MRWRLDGYSFALGAGITAAIVFLTLVLGDILGLWSLAWWLWGIRGFR